MPGRNLTPVCGAPQVCINLKPPCDTMEKFAANGQWLEWALYDVKRDNYECCPVGYSSVQVGQGREEARC